MSDWVKPCDTLPVSLSIKKTAGLSFPVTASKPRTSSGRTPFTIGRPIIAAPNDTESAGDPPHIVVPPPPIRSGIRMSHGTAGSSACAERGSKINAASGRTKGLMLEFRLLGFLGHGCLLG